MDYNESISFKNLYLKSILIGSAFVIPGLSAGTLAFVFGVYSLILNCLFGVWGKNFKKSFEILSIVALGSLTGLSLFVFIMNRLIFPYPFVTALVFSLFAGFVLGSLSLIRRLQEPTHSFRQRLTSYLTGTIGFSLVLFLLLYYSPSCEISTDYQENSFESFSFQASLFLANFFASGFMLLPGISGSAVLLSLGYYAPTLFILKNIMIYPILIITLGTLAGIFFWGALIRYLLGKYKNESYSFILGLILGSSVQILSSAFYLSDKQVLSLFFLAGTFFLGWLISSFINQLNKENNTP